MSATMNKVCRGVGFALLLAGVGCSDSDGTEVPPTETTLPACWTESAEGPGYGTVDPAVFVELERVAGTAEDGPFHMLNLIKYREQACYRDGRETDLTGREADALYAPIDFLAEIGAQVVFVGDGEATLLGDGVKWDVVAIVLYPSRAQFLSMVQNEEFQARSEHKDAGLEKSIVMVSDLRESQLPDDFVPVTSPYPATAEDPAVEMVHLIRFNDEAEYADGSAEDARTGEEALRLYEDSAAEVALEIGVYPTAWFDVRDVLIGDGRQWDQFRINHMPSHAAFDALVADPRRTDGQHHREAGIADTYSVLVAPLLNTLGPIGD